MDKTEEVLHRLHLLQERLNADAGMFSSPELRETLKRLTESPSMPRETEVPPHVVAALKSLGLPVSQAPQPSELKEAYRKLAKLYHPDCGGDAKKMQEINSAYNTVNAWIGKVGS